MNVDLFIAIVYGVQGCYFGVLFAFYILLVINFSLNLSEMLHIDPTIGFKSYLGELILVVCLWYPLSVTDVIYGTGVLI